MRLADYVDDIHDVIVQAAYVPTSVVGFSFGGMLAQVLAIAYPSDVTSLVVGACPSTLADLARTIMRERATAAEREGMAAVVSETLRRWFTDEFIERGGAEDVRQRLLRDAVEGWAVAWRAIACLDTQARLRDVHVPTLCVAGERDASAPPEVVKAVADAVPGGQFVVVAGAPHMLFIEQPRTTGRIITAFLEAGRSSS
jgi:3-oxoadipate enol-lactonase